ncbi:hypothetical protein Aduo_011219 [Ancylostoma duodenale]
MFHIILLCTALGHILAHSLPDVHEKSSRLVTKRDLVRTDEEIEAFVKLLKITRDVSLKKEKHEKAMSLVGQYGEKPTRETVEAFIELYDYELKSINDASPKVKDVYKKLYELVLDPKLYKMDFDTFIAEREKLYSALSETEKKEWKEFQNDFKEKGWELGINSPTEILAEREDQ